MMVVNPSRTRCSRGPRRGLGESCCDIVVGRSFESCECWSDESRDRCDEDFRKVILKMGGWHELFRRVILEMGRDGVIFSVMGVSSSLCLGSRDRCRDHRVSWSCVETKRIRSHGEGSGMGSQELVELESYAGLRSGRW
jgi:hypothetical protein